MKGILTKKILIRGFCPRIIPQKSLGDYITGGLCPEDCDPENFVGLFLGDYDLRNFVLPYQNRKLYPRCDFGRMYYDLGDFLSVHQNGEIMSPGGLCHML